MQGSFHVFGRAPRRNLSQKLTPVHRLPVSGASITWKGSGAFFRSVNRWSISGLAAICLLVAGLHQFTAWSTQADRDSVGRGPRPTAVPDDVIAVDLSHLGLTMATAHDARHDPTWAHPEWRYREGKVADYATLEGLAASVWALKYLDEKTSSDDFVRVSKYQSRACGTYVAFDTVISCSYSKGHEKLFLFGTWIVSIATWRDPGVTVEVSIDAVRDALAESWRTDSRS